MKFRGKLLPAERTIVITRTHPIKLLPVLELRLGRTFIEPAGVAGRYSQLHKHYCGGA